MVQVRTAGVSQDLDSSGTESSSGNCTPSLSTSTIQSAMFQEPTALLWDLGNTLYKLYIATRSGCMSGGSIAQEMKQYALEIDLLKSRGESLSNNLGTCQRLQMKVKEMSRLVDANLDRNDEVWSSTSEEQMKSASENIHSIIIELLDEVSEKSEKQATDTCKGDNEAVGSELFLLPFTAEGTSIVQLKQVETETVNRLSSWQAPWAELTHLKRANVLLFERCSLKIFNTAFSGGLIAVAGEDTTVTFRNVTFNGTVLIATSKATVNLQSCKFSFSDHTAEAVAICCSGEGTNVHIEDLQTSGNGMAVACLSGAFVEVNEWSATHSNKVAASVHGGGSLMQLQKCRIVSEEGQSDVDGVTVTAMGRLVMKETQVMNCRNAVKVLQGGRAQLSGCKFDSLASFGCFIEGHESHAVLEGCSGINGAAIVCVQHKGTAKCVDCCSEGAINPFQSRFGGDLTASGSRTLRCKDGFTAHQAIMTATNCIAEDNTRDGFLGTGGSTMVLEDCRADGCQGTAIAIREECSKLYAKNCSVRGCPNHCFQAHTGAQAELYRCHSVGGECGFNAMGSNTSAQATDSTFVEGSKDGACARVQGTMKLFKCKTVSNKQYGYKAVDHSKLIIDGCSSEKDNEGCAALCASVIEATNTTVSNSVVYGFHAKDKSRLDLNSCKVAACALHRDGADYAGIHAESRSQVQAKDCAVSGTVGSAVLLLSSGKGTFHSCVFENSTRCCGADVQDEGSALQASSCRFERNAKFQVWSRRGAHAKLERCTVTVHDGDVHRNTRKGLSTKQGGTLIVQDCSLSCAF